MPDTRPLVVLLDNIELELEAKGLESTRIRAFFLYPDNYENWSSTQQKHLLANTGRRGENYERSLQRTTSTRLGR